MKEGKRESESVGVEKWVRTDLDFQKMGWHDVRVHGIGRYEKVERDKESEKHFWGTELLLDIDYILKWVRVRTPKDHFEFWVSPSTLVFENVTDFQMNWVGVKLDWEIEDIVREKARYPGGVDCWKWKVSGTGMVFLASGYKQYIRRTPILTNFQYLTWEERDGVSFAKQTGETA